MAERIPYVAVDFLKEHPYWNGFVNILNAMERLHHRSELMSANGAWSVNSINRDPLGIQVDQFWYIKESDFTRLQIGDPRRHKIVMGCDIASLQKGGIRNGSFWMGKNVASPFGMQVGLLYAYTVSAFGLDPRERMWREGTYRSVELLAGDLDLEKTLNPQAMISMYLGLDLLCNVANQRIEYDQDFPLLKTTLGFKPSSCCLFPFDFLQPKLVSLSPSTSPQISQ